MEAFVDLASRPCQESVDLLLSLAAEFVAVDREETTARLDDAARGLFGIGPLAPLEQAGRVQAAMRDELGFKLDCSGDPDSLLLPLVLRRRRGHPLALVTIAAQLAERAGAGAAVCSTSQSWMVVLEHEGDVALLDAGIRAAPERFPSDLHAHCMHQLAFSTLSGLVHCYSLKSMRRHARRASALRLALPLDGVLRAKVQRELDAFGER